MDNFRVAFAAIITCDRYHRGYFNRLLSDTVTLGRSKYYILCLGETCSFLASGQSVSPELYVVACFLDAFTLITVLFFLLCKYLWLLSVSIHKIIKKEFVSVSRII